MLKIIPDEVPEIAPGTQFDPDPTYGARKNKLEDFVKKNVFVTLFTGKTLVGRLEKNGSGFTVGTSETIGNALVETVREV